MTDTDRLAALLHEAMERLWCTPGEPEDVAAEAARLVAAGVTCSAGSDQQVTATPAPLDEDWKALYDNAVEKVNDLWYAAQPILDAAMDVFPEEWVDPESSMAMPVTLRGRDVFALRAAQATPAPLDVLVAAKAVVDAWEETVTATVISRTNWAIERLRYALAATPAPLAPHPGQNHDYRMTCLRCGEPTSIQGYLDDISHTPAMLIAVYRRDGDIYVFEGYER